MIKVGRYGVAFSRVLWFQTQVPTRVWHFLCFWFLKEVNPEDIDTDSVDKEPQFPVGTKMEYEGRKYRYWKMAKKTCKEDVACRM